MKRRDFVKWSAGAALCACGAASASSCSALLGSSNAPVVPAEAISESDGKITLDLNQIPSLQTKPGSAKTEIGDTKLLIARKSDGDFLVFENKCTHGGQELNFEPGESRFRCTSLGHSKFTLEGEKIAGPAKGPLKKFEFEQEGDKLAIMLS